MSSTHSLFRQTLVPVANKEDAKATMEALRPHLTAVTGTVIAIHVIEKAGGAPDKASVEQRERQAKEIFEIAQREVADTDVDFHSEIRYGADIAATIIEAAHEQEASAIVFTPRGGSRWVKLLAGDVTTDLLNESDLPVLVLPDVSGE